MGDWGVKVTTTGMDALLRDIRRASSVPPVVVTIRHTAGPKRTANKNAKIAAIQKKLGRNPWFLKAAELRHLQRHLTAAVERISAGQPRAILTAAKLIGEEMIALYRKHIEQGRGARGPLAKLAKGTAIQKAKKHGRRMPILVDTGELRDSLTYKVIST